MELQELAQRIRRGDREALKTLISEYGVGVYQKAYQKTQDKVLAREATRQTFAQLVTSLQEQTDMDGWELWLNALAKKNIETYCNIGSDMAYLENQLNTELFSSAAANAPAALHSAKPAQDPAKLFAAQQRLEAQQAAKRQYEEQQAQLLAQQREAQQAQLLAMQQQAQRQYEAQLLAQQQEAQRQYEAQLLTQQQLDAQQQPLADAQEPPQKPAQTQSEKRRQQKSERLFSGKAQPSAGSAWPVITLLVLLCVLLVWLVLGVAMSLNWLPKLPLGYDWFNAHIFELF